MNAQQFWFFALLIGITLMFSTMRVKKEDRGGTTFFHVITINDNKRILLAHASIDIAVIGLCIVFSLSFLPNWFYVICGLLNIVVFGKIVYQSQRDAVETYLEEVRQKRKIKDQEM